MKPRVTLMLAWFDEQPDMLRQCVKSAAVIGHRIVAADGAYEQVADRASESPPEQKEAIEQAAKEVGIEIRFLEPCLWGGQVQKRNALLAAATEDLADGDWVMPLDADWVLHGIRAEIHAEIHNYKIEQYSVKFRQTKNPSRNILRYAPHSWHVQYNGQTKAEPLLFRAMEDMKLETSHWDYSGVRKNGIRVGFSGGARFYTPAIARDLQATFLIEHRCMFRDVKTLKRNKQFCILRDQEKKLTGIER